VAQKRFLDRGAENIIYNYRFAQKLLSIFAIIKNVQWELWPCTFSSFFSLEQGSGAKLQRKGVWGRSSSTILGIFYLNNPFLDMFQLKFCLKLSKLVNYCMSLYLNAAF